jgi:hypothetical protein
LEGIIRIDIGKPEDTQVIIGHAGFIKTVEDLYEAMVSAVPGIKFGIAFCEASGPRLIRSDGNDDTLRYICEKNMEAVGAGHSFIIIFSGAYPINVIRHIRSVPEVAEIYCATANKVSVLVYQDGTMRGIIGIIDGDSPLGKESDEERAKRTRFLREIGYKRGIL